jgi:hypothetical protein
MTTDRRRRRNKRRWSRVLALLLVLAALGAVWFHWQQTGIFSEEIPVTDEKLPDAFAGLRIALVSDMQSAQFGEDNETLLAAVAALEPDLIAITGDLVDRYHTDLTMVEPLCTGLAAIAPTYYVTGNHEWALGTAAVRELKQTISDCGVTVLSNQYLTLEREGESIVLAGIDDPNGYADQKTLAQLMTEIRGDLGDPYVVLLAHRNDGELYAECGVDLTLCGHAHGGIIRLPFTDGLLSTDRTLFPTWTSGLYQLERGQMVVSRGLGNSGSTVRLFNRPHLPVVILTK